MDIQTLVSIHHHTEFVIIKVILELALQDVCKHHKFWKNKLLLANWKHKCFLEKHTAYATHTTNVQVLFNLNKIYKYEIPSWN